LEETIGFGTIGNALKARYISVEVLHDVRKILETYSDTHTSTKDFKKLTLVSFRNSSARLGGKTTSGPISDITRTAFLGYRL